MARSFCLFCGRWRNYSFALFLVILRSFAASRCEFTYGIAKLPPRNVVNSVQLHHRACRDSCIDEGPSCGRWRFWEDGSCALFRVDGYPLPPTKEERGEMDRRRLNFIPHGNIKRGEMDEANAGLTKEAFERLPKVVRGGIHYDKLRNAYEIMLDIWNEKPFKPVDSDELEKWGAVLPGRSEGRVLECLKRLALINIRRDGSIMIRKYPGKVPGQFNQKNLRCYDIQDSRL